MTVPPAALPGHTFPQAPVEYVEAPGDFTPLGCPACLSTADLVVTVPATIDTAVEVRRVSTATAPEVVPVGDEFATPDPNGRYLKIACTKCRWAYTGPNPLGKLLPVDA